MSKFKDYLKSWDQFGNATTMNYKGDRTYKTSGGAFFSIGIQTFLLVFGLFALMEVMAYQDPQITQVSSSHYNNTIKTSPNNRLNLFVFPVLNLRSKEQWGRNRCH